MLEQGKLYKVKDFALSDDAEFGAANRATVRDHGYLWIWDGIVTGGDTYWLRSLATGETTPFSPEELETSE